MATAATPSNIFLQQGNSQVFMSWDVSSGATTYRVQRGTDGNTYASVGTSSTPGYLDATVTDGTLYYYQVASINGDGTSAYSTAQTIVSTPTGEMSLGQIRLLSQQRADRVNSTFVTLPEWNSYINQSYFELYDMLVTLYEDYYLADPALFQTSGSSSYQLPNGSTPFTNMSGQSFVAKPFYKLLGVDCGLSSQNNAWVTLKKYDFIARNRYVFPNITSVPLGVFNMQYRVMGDRIYFIPQPASGQTIRLWYIPRVTQLLQDNDIMDGISGWTEYVVVDAAIKALQKEESDVSVLMAEKQMLTDRINASGMNRDAGQPETISNVRTWSERWGGAGGDPGGGPWGGA